MCCRHRWSLDVPVRLPLRRWSSFCVALNLQSRRAEVVQDGLIQGGQEGGVAAAGGEALQVAGGGQLFVGQEQDAPGGGFTEFQSLSGTVSALRVYGAALPLDQLRAFTTCRPLAIPEQPLLDLANVTADFEVRGANVTEAPPQCDSGDDDGAFNVVFPEPRLFDEAEQLCRVMGGAMAVPRSAAENEALLALTAAGEAGCGDGTGDTLWLGVRGNQTQKKWQDAASAAPVAYKNFDHRGAGGVRGLQGQP